MATAAPTINGQSGAHEQPQRYGYDETGPFLIRSWHGTRAAIASMYSTCVAAEGRCEVKQGVGIDVLEARFAIEGGPGGGGYEAPVDTWEFHASHVEKDILEADNATINSITDDNKGVIRHRIDNPGEDPPRPFVADGSQTTAESVWKLMLTGMRSIRVNAPVLRHTQTVSNVYMIKAALTGVGAILSSATLSNFEQIPVSVLFNIPTDVSTRTGFSYGWFKLHPTIRSAARQKMQIESEYEYGLWPTAIYGSPL